MDLQNTFVRAGKSHILTGCVLRRHLYIQLYSGTLQLLDIQDNLLLILHKFHLAHIDKFLCLGSRNEHGTICLRDIPLLIHCIAGLRLACLPYYTLGAVIIGDEIETQLFAGAFWSGLCLSASGKAQAHNQD